eukprot:CAMPEP_0177606280 /NCGR_PEP_ID=MMETSP0419_2-20121207/17213_1 /TAXON_ID=582737 /ORGANISM="Tetraselmis sp., Strain GSL018" /LENGTH=402 /DNA_ID=CAMNT_0019100611 /DNA_START=23 /DNA_END=1228 /DNA_ORIENTATION=+
MALCRWQPNAVVATSRARRSRLLLRHEQGSRGYPKASRSSAEDKQRVVSDEVSESISRRELFARQAALATVSVTAPQVPSSSAADNTLPTVPTATLAPGLEISQVVKGCWQLSGGHRGDKASDRTQGQDAVTDFAAFADAGITTLDTADIYGPSEALIGKYLRSKDAGSPPSQVLTKFCCFGGDMFKIDRAFVEKRIRGSMERLGVRQLDLVQFYWNDYSVKSYVDAACYLADLQAQGLIRHVGLTNFDVERIDEMRSAGVTIASNQVQYSPLDRRPEVAMASYCRDNGIALLPYGVAAGGFFSDSYLGVPPSSVKIDTYSKSKYASVIREAGGWEWFQELLAAMSGVAAKHGVSVANVAARWTLDRPTVPAIIVGARNARHIPDHQALFRFSLDESDRAAI